MVFKPVMFLLNIPWHEAGAAGGFFGEKIVLNEFVAYIDLGKVQDTLSPRTVAIVTSAPSGFAHFLSNANQLAVTGRARAHLTPDTPRPATPPHNAATPPHPTPTHTAT